MSFAQGPFRPRSMSVYEERENTQIRRNSLAKPTLTRTKPRIALSNLANLQKWPTALLSKKSPKKSDRKGAKPSIAPTESADTQPSEPQPLVIKRPRETNYELDILKYLQEVEAKYPNKIAENEALRRHPIVRRVVINRLVEIHHHFNLSQQSLYLAVGIVDRFLQTQESAEVSDDMRLIVATAMFIATKYEDSRVLSSHKLVLMSFHTKKEVVKMEFRILRALNFSLGRPTPLEFMEHYFLIHKDVTQEHRALTEYLMELTLIDFEFCRYPSSQLAAAALSMALKILDKKDELASVLWPDTLAKLSGYTFGHLLPVTEKICQTLCESSGSQFQEIQAIHDKYGRDRWANISDIAALRSPHKLFEMFR